MAENLTTLAAAKAWLNVDSTASDPIITGLVGAWSRAILTYLSRGSLLSSSGMVRLDGTGGGRVMLPRWPVTAVSAVSIDGATIAGATAGVSCPNGFLVEPWDGIPPGRAQALDVFGSCFTRGRQNVAITMTAGYLVANEAATIPATPFKITAAMPHGPFAADAGVTFAANGVPLTKIGASPTAGQYAADATTGIYTFAAADAASAVLISYSFVPADIAQIATALVGEDYRYRDRIGQISKSLGGQETMSFSQAAIPARYKIILDQYANVIPF